jgi:hypothetical protein
LKLETDEPCLAIEDSSCEHEYYLDLETGEILLLAEDAGDEDNEGLRERIEDGPTSLSRGKGAVVQIQGRSYAGKSVRAAH